MVDKDSEFYNRSIKLWSLDDDIEMHSADNEGKPVVAEKLINQMKQLMNATIHITAWSKSSLLIQIQANISTFMQKNNSKDLTFEVRDHVRISKYRKIEQLLQKFALEVGLQKFL